MNSNEFWIDNKQGKNIFFVLPSKKSNNAMTYMITFNYQVVNEVILIISFIQEILEKKLPLPHSILFVGLDQNF